MEDAIKDAEHPIYYSGVYQEYGLRLNSGYEYSIMKYCNWCGAELPSSRREQWFDSLEKQGIDPWENDIPIHYFMIEYYLFLEGFRIKNMQPGREISAAVHEREEVAAAYEPRY